MLLAARQGLQVTVIFAEMIFMKRQNRDFQIFKSENLDFQTEAERGRQVIASPTECCYLDFDLGVTDLEQAYSFRPIPAQVPELNSPLLFSP